MPEWNRPKTESFEAFKQIRDLDSSTLENEFKRAPIDVLKRVTQMESNAKEYLAKFDLENGLIFYSRAMDIGLGFLRRAKMRKPEGQRTNSENDIYKRIEKIVMDCLCDSEKLTSELKKLYVQSTVITDSNGAATSISFINLQGKNYELISPRSIVKSLKESGELKYLLIDIREPSGEQVRYEPNENALAILNLPKSSFPTTGLTLKTCISVLPSQDKHKLHRISEFEMVIVMGRETDDDRESLNAIATALVVYNYTAKIQRFCIMDGGFNAWKKFYPPYVSGVKQRPSCVDNDDLSSLIRDFRKKASISEAPLYPDIFTPSKPPRDSPNPPAPAYNSPGDSPLIPSTSPLPPASSTIPPLPTLTDVQPYPSIGGSISSGPSLPNSSSSTALSSILYPTTIAPPSIGNQNASLPSLPPVPRVPNVPGRELKPLSQVPRPVTEGTAVAFIPSINRSDKPSMREMMTPQQRNGLIEMFKLVQANTSSASTRGGTRPGFTGLHNNGNTCFMNATLQALFHTNVVRRLFTQENFPAACNVSNKMGTNGVMVAAVSALFDLMWGGQFRALRITRFISLFSSEVNSTLADGHQHDAHEFQTFLLDALHEDTNVGLRKGFEQNYKGGANIAAEGADFERKNKGFADSPIQTVFYLQTISELTCEACGETSATFEESSCLSLELPSSPSTFLSDSMGKHFSEVRLSGGECWNCPRCRGARPSRRNTRLWRLPPVMVIHLKRFAYRGGGYVKNEIDVSFPLERLDLRPYFHPSSPHRSSTLPYQLYSVTNHTGSLSSGHYTSITSIDGSWMKCDDECLSSFDPRNISPSGSYILFYKNVN
ncbi:hypothetical protein PMAYCL1PPCAC_30025 [Pristionchus mayeri]|uniref:Ubiquitin carboxyl-terminal hydrolase n=1 Tax=Pristionchus mayeri TaxID=1317129 RepID=A0AAN5DCX3_9BILA|nr:hypothetical protein PMAYCL1PPCAC_30025 [Pristionchus mayeri]